MSRLRISTLTMLAAAVLALLAPAAGARDTMAPVFQSPTGALEHMTASASIENGGERGLLTHPEEVLYKAYSLYAPELLPEAYRGNVTDKCGTHVAREIEAALGTLPPAVAEEIRGLRSRPSCDTHYDTAHFRIHFDTSGPHMILGWPDTSYRDSVAVAAELSYEHEVSVLGFRAPPSDGGDPDGGGGNSLYDIYIQNCTGYYGYCQGSYTVPSTPRTDCTSYVVIDNDYAGFGYPDPTDPMKVTVAHEFCHACQYSSNCWADTWYMECTSVWVEDVVYDGINDYTGYIPYYLNYPYASIEWQDGTGLRMYGSCVWNFFLTEAVAPTMVPSIWSRLEYTSNETSAFDYCLSLEGTDLEEAFGEYAVWNWFTWTRDDGNHYDEGATWALVPVQRTYSTYPVIGGSPLAAHRPDHLAWNYIHFSNPGGPEVALDVVYDGPDLALNSNRAFVNTKNSGGTKAEHSEITLDGAGQGGVTILGWEDLSLAAVVVVNTSTNRNDMEYTIDADRCTPVDGSFYGVSSHGGVTLRWTLARPHDVVALNLLRATSAECEYEVLNDAPLAPTSPGSYVDADVRPGEVLRYRLEATMWDGSRDIVEPGDVVVRMEGTLGLRLSAPSPNPFRDRTAFEYSIPSNGARARLAVYDVAGRTVATLFDGWVGSGRHEAEWNGLDGRGAPVASGVYFCTLEVPGAIVSKKVMLLR